VTFQLGEAIEIVPMPPRVKPPSQTSPPRWQLGLIAAALGALYFPIARYLIVQWWTDPNFQHGWFVPLFSLFVLWENRKRLAELPSRPAWSALWMLAFGLAVLAAGVMGAELFLSRVSFLFALAGLTALLWGWNHLRAVLFPLCFLLLMIPIPEIIFSHLESPLQTVASISASDILSSLGLPVLREGNVIELPRKELNIADACSGIRSLMSLATLSIIYGYLTEPRIWARVVLALASLPIAVASNSLRIVITGLIVQYGDPEKADGFYHIFSGILVFLASVLLLFLLHRLLQIGLSKGARR
jgi:exosortase